MSQENKRVKMNESDEEEEETDPLKKIGSMMYDLRVLVEEQFRRWKGGKQHDLLFAEYRFYADQHRKMAGRTRRPSEETMTRLSQSLSPEYVRSLFRHPARSTEKTATVEASETFARIAKDMMLGIEEMWSV